jgi:hypothetical protein
VFLFAKAKAPLHGFQITKVVMCSSISFTEINKVTLNESTFQNIILPSIEYMPAHYMEFERIKSEITTHKT